MPKGRKKLQTPAARLARNNRPAKLRRPAQKQWQPARQDSTLTKLSSSSTMPDPEVVQASLMRPSTRDLHDASRSPKVRSMRKVRSGKGQGRVPEEPPQAQQAQNLLNDYLLDCYGRSHRDSPRDRHWENLAVTPLQSKSLDLQPSPAINTPRTPSKLKQGTRPASQQVSARKSNKRRRQVEQVPTAGVPETQIDGRFPACTCESGACK